MHIQRLNPSHAAVYRALMLDAYAQHPDAFTSSAAERAALPLAWWEGRLNEAPSAAELVLGSFTEEQLAGVAGLAFESREKVRHKAILFGMYVLPQSRGAGLGLALVDAVLKEAGARTGLRVVQLTVTQGNAGAAALYARRGFSTFGVEPLAVRVGDGFVAKVHMACDLAQSPPVGDKR